MSKNSKKFAQRSLFKQEKKKNRKEGERAAVKKRRQGQAAKTNNIEGSGNGNGGRTERAWKKSRTSAHKALQKEGSSGADAGGEEFGEEGIKIYDPETGESLLVDRERLGIIQRIIDNQYGDEDYDPYQLFEDFFTKDSLSGALKPKRAKSLERSRIEVRAIKRLVRAIQKGRLVLGKRAKAKGVHYDVWERDFGPVYLRPDYIPAPKQALPRHEESYNPSPEYLPTEDERAEWERSEQSTRRAFLPTAHSSMRHIPYYPRFIQDRFARCLDLYMCARQRRNKLMIDPDSMLPRLPSAEELGPFPATKSTQYLDGHAGAAVKSVSVDTSGKWLASAGGEYVVIWDITSGRARWQVRFEGGEIGCLAWRPLAAENDPSVLAFSVGCKLYIVSPFATTPIVQYSEDFSTNVLNSPIVEWKRSTGTGSDVPGLQLLLTRVDLHPITHVSWHRKGDFLATVAGAVTLHQLSQGMSQNPFRKLVSPVSASFSPVRAELFVATKHSVRLYSLRDQKLSKKFGAMNTVFTTDIAVHPGGDNFVIGGAPGRVFWFDIDLSSEPYKALFCHSASGETVRAVAMHPKLPLFASVSSSLIEVCHGEVFEDLNMNAMLVPVKKIAAASTDRPMHNRSVAFHPGQPWLFVGDDAGTITLYV